MNLETEQLNITIPLPHSQNMSANTSSHTFDLPGLIEKMKQSYAWAIGELDTIILLKSPVKQIVLTALHEGTEIVSFQSNDSIIFQIIEGKLVFHTRKKTMILNKGQLLTLEDKIEYNLIAKEETMFLLTIANSGLQMAKN